MSIFKASYIGGLKDCCLKFGEVYNVKRILAKDNGKLFFILEGIEGEYESPLFHELKNKGFFYLASGEIPKVGSYMRLIKHKNDMNEFMTGEVKVVENSKIPGVYIAYTEKNAYSVSSII